MVEKAQVKSNILSNKIAKKQVTSSIAATTAAFETPRSPLQTTTKKLSPRKSKPAAPIVTLTKTGPVAPAGKHSETSSPRGENSLTQTQEVKAPVNKRPAPAERIAVLS